MLEDVFFFGDDRFEGELLVALALMGFRGALTRTPMWSTICSMSARGSPARRWAVGADQFDHVGARERRLVDVRRHSAMRARSSALRGCARRSARAAKCASRSSADRARRRATAL